MFTGIVEETGRVLEFTQSAQSWRMRVQAQLCLQGLTLGDSIAVDGCCLTVVGFDASSMSFDLLEETRKLTHFFAVKAGVQVNLERSLRFNGKVGGHFVTGHIDGVGHILVFEMRGKDMYLNVSVPTGYGRYLVHKGSIAIDGISLTIAEVKDDSFAVWLIPHTLEVTNLKQHAVGSAVNLEFDLLGKYVEKLMKHQA